ncbi:MAG: DNA-binding response regulator [Ekhidna sp.]|nr:DNA-binding response regulator [Ekhidna sp.]
MSQINCIIIEDEPIARQILADYISQLPHLNLLHEFESAIEVIPFLKSNAIDLIFLDIHLPAIKGLDFLESISTSPNVIVTTAYHQYAVKSFELNVLDCLLKPFSFQRFLKAVSRLDEPKIEKPAIPQKNSQFIIINVDRRKTKVDIDSIQYIESAKEYVRIFTTSGEIKSKMRLTDLFSDLESLGFAKPHRSFIVPIQKIDSYDHSTVAVGEKMIPIGKVHKKTFFDQIAANRNSI